MAKLTRQQMINAIIDHEIEVNYSDESFLREMLVCGWRGIEQWTDKEIEDRYDYIVNVYN